MTGPISAKTMPQLVRAAAAAYGDAIAVRFSAEGQADETFSFAELDSRSAELARGLIARGAGKGSRIGFIMPNGPDFALTFAAIGRIGAIAVPISTMIRANELIRVLRQSDIAGLIVQRRFLGYDYAERLCEALPALRDCDADLRLAETPYLRWIVSAGTGLPQSIRDRATLLDAAASVDEVLLAQIEQEVYPTDQLIEIYTSGSMALPKGVKHDHGPILFRTHWLGRMLGFEPGQQRPAALPMFWVGGLMMVLMPAWATGATTVCGEKLLSDSRIAMGSVMADEDMKLLANQKPPFWGLGMSETAGPYSYGDVVRAPGYPMCSPMDHWAEGYDVRIADEEGREVAEGEVGEVQIRGYPVTPGLHKIERADTFTADGFYRTGDTARREGTRVHFVGRGGDMIKTAGSNVSPAEVEMELQGLDGVHSAYVVGLPDKQRGQVVVAAVVANDGATLDFATIETTLRRRLSAYKVPRAYFQIERDEVPLLHSNKVARREIAAMIAARMSPN